MNTTRTILFGFSLVAGAILISHASADTKSDDKKYDLSSSDGIVYRMNTATGSISSCTRGMTVEEAPDCTPWTK